MRANRKWIALGAVLIMVSLAIYQGGSFLAYRMSQRYVWDNSERLIIYSIRSDLEDDYKVEGANFHRNSIVGQTRVTDPKLKTQLIDALNQGLQNGKEEEEYSCFIPRYGIRAICGERTVDVVICFSCGKAEFFEKGKYHRQPISRVPQNVFYEVWKKAKLPL